MSLALFGLTAACAARQADVQSAAGAGAQCLVVPVDTGRGFVHGSIASESTSEALSPRLLASVLETLRVALVGDTLTLDSVDQLFDIVVTRYGIAPDPRPAMMPRWAAHPAFTTEIAFTLSEQGTLVAPEIIANGDGAVAATLLRGINASPPITEDRPTRPHRLRLRVALEATSDAISAPLIAARQVRVKATPPRQVPGRGAPLAPRSGADGRTNATVLTWFVVDAKGVAVPESFVAAPPADDSHATAYRPFVDAVRRALREMRHQPAIAGGCATARRVALTVRFDVAAR